jgi:hypothetical protein
MQDRKSHVATPNAGASQGADQRRRKLLAIGASSALLMSAASRPVWASSRCTPSALASANLSGQHTFEGCGISAGWWINFKDRWPISVQPSMLFHAFFDFVKVAANNGNGVGNQTLLFGNLTLGQVIDLSGANNQTNPHNIGMHVVAALLNATQFQAIPPQPGYPYTPAEVIEMYDAMNGQPASAFAVLKTTLEMANNMYDDITDKP